MKVGEMKISVDAYTTLVRENEKMYQKLKAISGIVMAEHIEGAKHGWRGQVYCSEIATLIGITLPNIPKDKEGEENEGQNN